ncbi:MAG: CPBP family intramembrane metalloprotease [Armatimonadetes bacterium]|nr:CPBP family intramembrane metalloprotease [Armatimonadota bacterium]
MHLLDACLKVAAYLICVGVALEFSHRFYWSLNKRVHSPRGSVLVRSAAMALPACIPMAAALIITLGFLHYVDRQSLRVLGLNCNAATAAYYITYGVGTALGCVTLVFLVGLLAGCIQVRRSRLSKDRCAYTPAFVEGLTTFFTAAVLEELIFRGYVFYELQNAFGGLAAILLSSLIFSSAHYIKHQRTPAIFALNAFMFGLLAAVCRYHTGTLWLPIGLHFGWNVVSGPIYGLPYSGRTYDHGVVASDVSGPEWLTGGHHSLDAGVLGTVALVIAALGLVAVSPVH